MDRRVVGLETEYGIALENLETGEPTAGDLGSRTSTLFGRSMQAASTVWEYRANGSRLYRDAGDHPEYATAECLSARDLVAQDRAGEEMLVRMSTALEQRGMRARIYKNNCDFTGHTYGCHENYQAPVELRAEVLRSVLVPFLCVRALMVGAGHLPANRTSSDVGNVERSQRHRWMEKDYTMSSTTIRGFILWRDEPLADRTRWWRVQLLCGDSNMSERSVWLKVGTTMLMLRMLEDERVQWKEVRLADPAHSAVSCSQRPEDPLLLASKKKVKPLSLLEYFYQKAAAYVAERGGSAEEHEILRWWGLVIDALKSDPDRLVGILDWATKRALLMRAADRHGWEWTDARLDLLALKYHELGSGLARRLEAAGSLDRVVDDDAVTEALVRPPANTRARLRGAAIRYAQENHATMAVSWETLTVMRAYGSREGRTFRLPDPQKHDLSTMGEVFRALRSANDPTMGRRTPVPFDVCTIR